MDYIISSGESSNGIILNNYDSMTVLDGGVAYSTMVNSYGTLFVSSGGTATEIIENGGYVSVFNGANVTFLANAFADLTVNKKTTVHSGTTANCATIKGGGRLIVSTGGITNSTTVSGGGELTISSGGTANSTTVSSGWFRVSSGGRANTTIVSGGQLEVHNGGTANNAIINSGGSLTVTEGGRANDIIVNSRGELVVSPSATANSITVSPGGKLTVWSGGTASIAFAPFGKGEISVYDAPEKSVLTYLEREANVYYGNMVSGTIGSANTMSELAIESGFSAIVYQDGQLANVTVKSGGSLTVSKGGKLTGRMIPKHTSMPQTLQSLTST